MTNLGIVLYCMSWFPWQSHRKVFHHLLALDWYSYACVFENLHHMFASKESIQTMQSSFRPLSSTKTKRNKTHNTRYHYKQARKFVTNKDNKAAINIRLLEKKNRNNV